MKPPMPYAGGKQTVAERIVSLLPEHTHYVEPYAGALSVLLAKPPSPIETVNDLDRHLVTFWRVLRDRPKDLERVCALTPNSRAELRAANDRPDDLDEVEMARRVWVRLTQARLASLRDDSGVGWRFTKGGNRMALAAYLSGYVERIGPAAERLRRVSLECRPALDVIADYGAHSNVCLYVDPPYLGATRGSDRLYQHEMPGAVEHAELLDALRGCRAGVVMSGYTHPLYEEALAGWGRHEFAALSLGSTPRIEVVWCNRPAPDRLFTEGSA